MKNIYIEFILLGDVTMRQFRVHYKVTLFKKRPKSNNG